MANMKWKNREDMILEAFMGKKDSKKKIMSQKCHEGIIGGFTQLINGIEYKFSYDMEAQTNFQEAYQLFQNQVITDIKWSAKLNGETVRLSFSKFQFEQLFYAGVKHKQSLISKLKDDIEPLINSAESEENLDNIVWDNFEMSPVNFILTETMDKEIDNLTLQKEMSDMALMEIANMVMMGG